MKRLPLWLLLWQLHGANVNGFSLVSKHSKICSKADNSRPWSNTPKLSSASQEIDTIKATIKHGNHEEIEERIKKVRAIASDVDGTLLSNLDHKLSLKTKNMIKIAVAETRKENGCLHYFFPATGKSRKGALDSLGPEIRDLLSQLPGVFVQGLYCVNADGNVIFEAYLPSAAIHASEALAVEFNATLIGNCGDIIYGNAAADSKLLNDVNSVWGEPVPIVVPSLAYHGPPKFHKLVFMSDDTDMLRGRMRPALEVLAHKVNATVTTSHPTVLEILPAGCSKALGVKKMCEYLGIQYDEQLMALGDAENDKGMLEMAAIGVSMGNGSPIAKEAADVIMAESSHEGGAGRAMQEFSLLGTLKCC